MVSAADTVPSITPERKAGNAVKDILGEVAVLVRAVPSREVRLVLRALRHSAAVRRSLGASVLRGAVDRAFANAGSQRSGIDQWLPEAQAGEAVPDLSDEAEDGSADAAAAAVSNDMEIDGDGGEKTKGGKDAGKGKGKGEGKDKGEGEGKDKGDKKQKKKDAAPVVKRRKLPADPTEAQVAATPEIRAYLQLLVLIHHVDRGDSMRAEKCAEDLVAWVTANTRHTMDPLAARAWFYLVRAVELQGRSVEPLRPRLLAAYRTACLRHDTVGQAVLLNLLVRGYLASGLYDQADKLVAKAEFPPDASPNQLARHLHYVGRIRAVQLDYTEAHRALSLALRKSPQRAAHGFRLLTTKFSVVVQLLMGDIPDRSVFHSVAVAPSNTSSPEGRAAVESAASPHLGHADPPAGDDDRAPEGVHTGLVPYFHLTKAVRDGDLPRYSLLVERYTRQFVEDATYTLVCRLGASVIKAALRRMSAAYSAIPLAEAAERLGVGSASAAAAVVARAARDGVADARVRRGTESAPPSVVSVAPADLYSTSDPQRALHERVLFANTVRAEARRGMRYRDQGGADDADAEERRRRAAEEEELAQVLAEEEDEEGEF